MADGIQWNEMMPNLMSHTMNKRLPFSAQGMMKVKVLPQKLLCVGGGGGMSHGIWSEVGGGCPTHSNFGGNICDPNSF